MTLVKLPLFAVAVLAASVASAKTCTWIGGTGSWSDAANWQDAVLPEDGDDIVVESAAGTGGNILLDGATTPKLASISITNGNGWNIQDGTVALMAGARIVSTTTTLKIAADLASDGDVDLVKRGAGSLSIAGGNAMPGRLIVEEGRLQPESEAAYGPVPAAYKADAIVLRNGGVLARADLAGGETITVGATRGITLDGEGVLCARGTGTLQIDAPIVGNGDLSLLRQSGYIALNAVNSYTGRTLLASDGAYAFERFLHVELGADGALPATTSLVGIGAGNSSVTVSVGLNGTTQRFAGIEMQDKTRVIFYGPGTARFGTDEDVDVVPENVLVSAGATLAYAGTGTVTPELTTSDDATFALESGSLVVSSSEALSLGTLRLAADRTVTLAAGVAQLPNDLVLEGDATLAASESPTTLLGSLTGAGTLTVTGADAVTFGAADATLRVLGAPIAGAPVTLDGWVRASVDPAAYAKASTCTLIGPYAGLAAGDVVLDGTAAGIDASDQIGADASVTVRNGGRFVVVAKEDMALANAFTIDADSKMTVGGPGRLDLTGASFTGGGLLALAGHEGSVVVLQGDLTGVTVSSSACDVYVPEGQTLTLGTATGTVRKTGPGTLVFAGEEACSCHLKVVEGLVRAAASATALGNVTVEAGARVVLDADEQVNNSCYVFLDGVFDLNGHTETLQRVYNTPASNTLRDAPTGAVVNTSIEPATLVTTAENVFYGAVTEQPGKIVWKGSQSNTSFFGPAGSAAPSEVHVSGSSCNFSYTRFGAARFVFHRARKEDSVISLAEIQLTWKGVPLPASAYDSVSATAATGSSGDNLVDGTAAKAWNAPDGSTNAVVTVVVKNYARFDGYRLTPGSLANAPKDWDVYVYRTDASGWMRVDSRRDVKLVSPDLNWSGFSYNASENFRFDPAAYLGEQLGTGTRVTLARSNQGMRVSSRDELRLGALAGTGNVNVEDGSWIAPGDMRDWTGSFMFKETSDRAGMARILLDAQLGGDAQPVRVSGNNANFSVENAGEAPVALLVDDATSQAQTHLRLADGYGPMGLVKRGTGATTLAIEESANTGATVVESGRLRVAGAHGAGYSVSARYLRIWPSKNNNGNDSNGFNWGMNDFQLLDADGSRVAFPAGTSTTAENGFHDSQTGARLIDGDISTRCLVWNTAAEKTEKKGYCSWVVIDMKQPVSFSGYRWYTAHNNAADQYRVPVEWTLETSDDGANWTVVSAANDPYTSSYGSGNTGFLRGPYGLTGYSDGKQTLHTLPSEFLVAPTPRTTWAPALKARYFRFQPHEVRGPSNELNAYGWMVAEFALFRDGARVDWPAGAKPTLTGGSISTSNGSSLSKFCDNVLEGGLDNANLHRVFVLQFPSYVTVDAGQEVVFDGYAFYNAAGGCRDQRIPTCWTVSVSADGKAWYDVDSRYGESVAEGNYAQQGPWSVAGRFPLLGATTATDALGDASPVTVAVGAELEIDSDYEKFGTLSGAGTVLVTGGSVAEVNACVDGTFSGAVTGAGTLAFCGAATQTLDNVSIGVASLELNGGTVTGTASRAGDLAVAFNGGVWSGTLAVSGALTATGTPSVALPASLVSGGRLTLFSYASADADTKAVLAGATVVGEIPAGLKARVRANETSCVLSVSADSTILIFR